MYILKIKGSAKIPDYIQIRDENFTLVAYFRSDRTEHALIKYGFVDKQQEMIELIKSLPYGKIKKL